MKKFMDLPTSEKTEAEFIELIPDLYKKGYSLLELKI